MVKQIHVYIKGDVIGVGFRAWMKIQSKLFLYKGWVRNVYDNPNIFGGFGGVEAVVQVEENKLEEVISLLKKGSSISRVDDVEIIYENTKQLFDNFEIKKSKSHQLY